MGCYLLSILFGSLGVLQANWLRGGADVHGRDFVDRGPGRLVQGGRVCE